ncbi:MAG: hypothetical protein K0R38_5587 [Polyangiaceae bacterium]|jgi:hypothetical protein|nr:hypothetical protein [Polyangiaceae bacterium]
MSVHEVAPVDVSDLEEELIIPPRSVRYFLSDATGVDFAAHAVAAKGVVTHGFANFYAMVARPDRDVVVRINRMKGRPDSQVGSVTTTPVRIPMLFDWSKLPGGLTPHKVLTLIDQLLELGPFGFRGPAAAHVPDHLASQDDGVRTTQVIAPGYSCYSNKFLARSMELIGEDFLYVTSANRSRHVTGAADEPAHYRGSDIKAEFRGEDGFVVLRHPDELAAQQRYPLFAPMSTTIIALHKLGTPTPAGRPRLFVERHGSLHVDDLRPYVERLGFGLDLGPKAQVRLTERYYAGPPSLRRA